jgi:hypothetical protein
MNYDYLTATSPDLWFGIEESSPHHLFSRMRWLIFLAISWPRPPKYHDMSELRGTINGSKISHLFGSFFRTAMCLPISRSRRNSADPELEQIVILKCGLQILFGLQIFFPWDKWRIMVGHDLMILAVLHDAGSHELWGCEVRPDIDDLSIQPLAQPFFTLVPSSHPFGSIPDGLLSKTRWDSRSTMDCCLEFNPSDGMPDDFLGQVVIGRIRPGIVGPQFPSLSWLQPKFCHNIIKHGHLRNWPVLQMWDIWSSATNCCKTSKITLYQTG